VFGDLIRIFGYSPNIGVHRVSAEKQLTMPPQKRSNNNIPAETDQEEHHHVEGSEISLSPLNLQHHRSRTKSKTGSSTESKS
jgi:hypothetical protein